MTAAELVDALSGAGPFTVFAPTDDAFALLPAGLVDTLLAEPGTPTLSTILQHHVVSGAVDAATVVGLTSATALAGGDIDIQIDEGTVVLNGTAQVTTTDLAASNGLIHEIDGVIIPQDTDFPGTIVDALASYPRFSTLVGAVASASLVETLNGDGPFTVFAPTNNAFTALGVDLSTLSPEDLGAILTYHVVAGDVRAADVVGLASATTVNGAPISISVDAGVALNGTINVTYTDIVTSNGVIHVIDAVLLPPGDIPTVATAAGTFGTLVAALGAAELADDVSAPNGPLTVFAPTDEAFARLPAGVVDSLLAEPGTPTLSTILLHHVVAGLVDSNAVVGLSSATPLGGGDLAIQIDQGTVVLNGTVQVSAVNVPASNGLIHVVDGVILPQDVEFPGTVVDALLAYPRFASLVDAVVAGELVGTLSGPGPFTVFAPTNNAFTALGIDPTTLPLADLQDILTYHVVAGEVLAADVVSLTEATMVNGDTITIDATSGVVLNGTVNVTFVDIVTSNGVIHVIDAVLVPSP